MYHRNGGGNRKVKNWLAFPIWARAYHVTKRIVCSGSSCIENAEKVGDVVMVKPNGGEERIEYDAPLGSLKPYHEIRIYYGANASDLPDNLTTTSESNSTGIVGASPIGETIDVRQISGVATAPTPPSAIPPQPMYGQGFYPQPAYGMPPYPMRMGGHKPPIFVSPRARFALFPTFRPRFIRKIDR